MKCSKYLIYGIKCEGKYIYVGQSTTYLRRPFDHLVKERGDEVEILEELPSADNIDFREQWWIFHLHAQGFNLENSEIVGRKLPKACKHSDRSSSSDIGDWVTNMRIKLGYTQLQMAERVGVGLRFYKELELGKSTCRMDKVNQVLNFLGYKLGAVPNEITSR